MGVSIEGIRTFLRYSDAANQMVLQAALPLSDAQLDKPFDMGRGSLRVTLLHILAGETTWLARWKGNVETPWPSESEPTLVSSMQTMFNATWTERNAYLGSLAESDLGKVQTYRDSKGELFEATLGDMLLQGCIHSTHHRAQAVNMLRRLDAGLVEMDYMNWVRRPVG